MNGLATVQNHNLTEFSESWLCPPANLCLDADEVHLWIARLDRENPSEFEQFLSDDEIARANRFRFETDRNKFMVGRGLLRIILAKYLSIDPARLGFEYGLQGKPMLGGEWTSSLKFNLSHSANLALLAVAENQEVGVDLEYIKPSLVEPGTISLCLTPRETAHFRTLSENEQTLFFFDCWTRKEAYLKANGDGLLISPAKIETSELDRSNFTIHSLPKIPGYLSALAAEAIRPSLKFWRIAPNS